MNILYPFHVTGFGTLLDGDNKETETSREYILCYVLYLDNSYKYRFADLNKCVGNDYVLKNSLYPRTINLVQILLLNCQPNYNSNSQSQYQGVRNQPMFTQSGKTGDD